jgi:hypothetical protein
MKPKSPSNPLTRLGSHQYIGQILTDPKKSAWNNRFVHDVEPLEQNAVQKNLLGTPTTLKTINRRQEPTEAHLPLLSPPPTPAALSNGAPKIPIPVSSLSLSSKWVQADPPLPTLAAPPKPPGLPAAEDPRIPIPVGTTRLANDVPPPSDALGPSISFPVPLSPTMSSSGIPTGGVGKGDGAGSILGSGGVMKGGDSLIE